MKSFLNRFSKTVNKLPESNIQAYFFHKCIENGLNCILEYKLNNSRFDCVLLDDDFNITSIIEFKSYKTCKPAKKNTGQIKKYKKYGFPVYLITRLEYVDDFFTNKSSFLC